MAFERYFSRNCNSFVIAIKLLSRIVGKLQEIALKVNRKGTKISMKRKGGSPKKITPYSQFKGSLF